MTTTSVLEQRGAPTPAAAEESRAGSDVATKTPVVILGSAGYVGGELLRILAAHPRLEDRGRRLVEPGGPADRRHLPAPRRGALPARASRAPIAGATSFRAASAGRSSPPRRTASRPRRSRRRFAGGGERRRGCRRRHFGRPPLPERRRVGRGLRPRAPGACSGRALSPARSRSIGAARRRSASPIPAASPPRRCSRSCRCSRSSSSSPRSRSRRSPARPAAAERRRRRRTIRRGARTSSPYQPLSHRHAPEMRALAAGRDRRRAGDRLRAALGPAGARHLSHAPGAAPERHRDTPSSSSACRASTPRARSSRSRRSRRRSPKSWARIAGASASRRAERRSR